MRERRGGCRCPVQVMWQPADLGEHQQGRQDIWRLEVSSGWLALLALALALAGSALTRTCQGPLPLVLQQRSQGIVIGCVEKHGWGVRGRLAAATVQPRP